ncbi:MAG TPA: heavy metal-associated domain-containing protein [Anaerolineales bacterium]
MNDLQEDQIDSIKKSLDTEELIASTVAHFFVFGMDSPLCARRVCESLLDQKGVLSVKVDLERKYATAFFDPMQTNPDLLIHSIERAGGNGKHRLWAELYLQVSAEAILAHANTPIPA